MIIFFDPFRYNPTSDTLVMANKRLSKCNLKTNELEPFEHSLIDEDVHEFDLNGVLSLTIDDNLGMTSSESVDSTLDSSDGESDDSSYGLLEPIRTLKTSIKRGLSISIIRERTAKVNFDIVNTRIAGHHKHVLYTLVVTRTPGLDSDKAIVEKRYSEFYKLYKELKKKYSNLMKSIEFPEKKLYGNLKGTVISDRSRLLQDFIRNIHESEEMRTSENFKNFFYIQSLQQGCRQISGGRFESALNYFLNGFHLQQKLALDSTDEVVATLGGIVECYLSLKSFEEAIRYSNAALELIGNDNSNKYLLPLLQSLKNTYTWLGEDASSIERRLKEIINMNNIEIEHLPSLRELTVKRFANK